jgi:uncharacterized membrane protein YphA (DoxX/SURF4 family)
MRDLLLIACVALGLWFVTLGLGFLGWQLNPWSGEAGSGESPLPRFGLPMLVCVIALSGFLHPALAFLAGGVAQYVACLLLAGAGWLAYRLVRRLLT